MSYDAFNLSALVYNNGFTQWNYKTIDDPAEVLGRGYFDKAAGMLRVGDFIMANTNRSGPGPMQSGILVVASNYSGEVRVSALSDFVGAESAAVDQERDAYRDAN